MVNLLISKEYKDAIKKMNNGKLDDIEDVKKCLFYIQNYPEDRIEYHTHYDCGSLYPLKYIILMLTDFFLLGFFGSLSLSTLQLILMFSSIFANSILYTVIFKKIINKKALEMTLEEERQLKIMANGMQITRNNKQAIQEMQDMVEENIQIDEYIKNIKNLITRVVQVKYKGFEQDIQSLLALAKEYLKCKEESKQTSEILVNNYGELLKKLNLLETQIIPKINMALDIQLNSRVISQVEKELQDLEIEVDKAPKTLIEEDLTPTLSLADGTEMKLIRKK